jgi:signal transduction histidine kinase
MGLSRSQSFVLHRRIVLVFLFFVAFPGVYVGYIGLRSVVQEQDLQRGVLVQSLERTLAFEIDKVERKLEEVEENAARDLLSSNTAHRPASLADFTESHSWIDDVFVYNPQLDLRGPAPFASPIFGGHPSLDEEKSVRDIVDAAKGLELRGDFEAAVSSYQGLLAEDLGLRSRIVLNMYLARAAAAIGNQELVRKAYTSTIRMDPGFRTTQPIPYAAFAWLEVIDDLVRQNKRQDALRKALEYYERMLDFYPQFSPDQYRYFLQKIHSRIDSLTQSTTAGEDLRTAVQRLEGREYSLTRLLARGERIGAGLKNQYATLFAGDSARRVHHKSLLLDGKSTPLSLVSIHQGSSVARYVVFVVRSEQLLNSVLLPTLRAGDWTNDLTVGIWRDSLQGTHEQELVRSRMHAAAVLFPAWEVTVSSKKARTISLFGIQAPLVSIGFGSLVVVVILLGIYSIYREIRREEELSKMKSEFISNVSHELKTPIAAIRMLADNLRENRVETEARAKEYYQLISREGARLSHLIENILDFSRIEEKKRSFRMERHDLAAIVSETVRQFTSLVEERSQVITLDIAAALPQVLIDPDAIALAVFNLLDNAVKYSERETPINVRISWSDGFACIAVEDQGIGISKPDQTKIFEKFYRVHEADGKKIPGSGIGLTLVKEIALAHHGRVEVRSTLNVGSTFRFMLPTNG